MKKFIVKVLAFLAFTSLFYSITLFYWGMYAPPALKPNLNYRIGSYGHMHSRLKEVKSYNNIDILFLGSSHAYRGFDTRIYKDKKLSVFNLGSSAQTPTQTLVLLNRYIDNLNPKLIIYDVYPGTLSSDGVESAVDIIANDKNDLHSLVMALKINHIKIYNTFLYGITRDFFKLNNSFKESLKKGNDIYIKGGFVQKEISYHKPKALEKKEIKLNNKQFSSFVTIVNEIKQKDIPLILVYIPISPSNYASYSNNNEFDSIMCCYSTYYNFNKILILNDSLHFYDSHHLNQLGVEIFNKELIERLPNMKQEVQIHTSK